MAQAIQGEKPSTKPVVPDAYNNLIEEVKTKLDTQATKYIPKMCELLSEAGFSTKQVRARVETDAKGLGWSRSTVIHALPTTFKHVAMAARGRKGGNATKVKRQLKRAAAAAATSFRLVVEVDDLDKLVKRARGVGATQVALEIDSVAKELVGMRILPKAKAVSVTA